MPPGYNRHILNRLRRLALVFVFFACPGLAFSQRSQLAGNTLVVLPFENNSKAPGIEWIGEAFPEVLGQRITGAYVIPRKDRLYAFDRLGIPANLRPSRATLYRIAEEMDVDYMVVGTYTFDGRMFTATAQVLDMNRLHLSQEITEGGPLPSLLNIQNALAWGVMRAINTNLTISRREFLEASPSIRLDAFENYMRGITDSERPDRIRHLRETLRLDPTYTLAILQLGKTYYEVRDYASAVSWLERVSREQPQAREANFYLGLACYYTGDFRRAEEAFQFVASQMPLTEVSNNLGVVAGRRGEKIEIEYFQKAAQADPKDADYRFNLAIALLRANDNAGAARQLKEALALRPGDAEANTLLQSLSTAEAAAPHATTPTPRLPLARIKRNYDESQFRQLALEIQNVNELKMRGQPIAVHAAFHVERGHEMLAQGFMGEAEKEFREAITLDPTLPAAHGGLARVLENRDPAAARSEAQSALRLQPSPDVYLLLARLDLKDNNVGAASDEVNRALALDPGNALAQALKREITARLAQKTP